MIIKLKELIKSKKILLFLIILIVIVFSFVFYIGFNNQIIYKSKGENNIIISNYKDDYYLSFNEYTSGKYIINNENNKELVLVQSIRGNPQNVVTFDENSKKIMGYGYTSYLKLKKPLLINNILKVDIMGLTREELIKKSPYFKSLEPFSVETPLGQKKGDRLVDENGNDYFVVFYKSKKVESVLVNLDINKNKDFFNEIFPSDTFLKVNEYSTLKENIDSNVFYFGDGTVSLGKDIVFQNNILCEIRYYGSSNIGLHHCFITDAEIQNNK